MTGKKMVVILRMILCLVLIIKNVLAGLVFLPVFLLMIGFVVLIVFLMVSSYGMTLLIFLMSGSIKNSFVTSY